MVLDSAQISSGTLWTSSAKLCWSKVHRKLCRGLRFSVWPLLPVWWFYIRLLVAWNVRTALECSVCALCLNYTSPEGDISECGSEVRAHNWLTLAISCLQKYMHDSCRLYVRVLPDLRTYTTNFSFMNSNVCILHKTIELAPTCTSCAKHAIVLSSIKWYSFLDVSS